MSEITNWMLARATDPKFINDFLEVTNGGTALLLANLIIFLVWSLSDQLRRAGLAWGDLIYKFVVIPVVIQVTVGLLTLVSGICVTRAVVWEWRLSTAGRLPFSALEISFLCLGSLLTGVGALCLQRVVTRPRFGHGPWIFSVVEGLVFVLASIFIR